MPTIAYRVLQADGCCIYVDPSSCDGFGAACRPIWGLQLASAAAPAKPEPKSKVLLVCTQQLASSADTVTVVAVDPQQRVAWCYKLVLAPGAQAATAKPVTSVCSTRRITLQGVEGNASPSKWQGIVTRNYTAQAGPQWQLQPAHPVPALAQAWAQQQVLGTFTAAAVLLDTAQHGTQQQRQQLQQLQELLSAVCAQIAAAASVQSCAPGAAASNSTSGGMNGAQTFHMLSAAAAGLLVAAGCQDGPQQHSSAACAAMTDFLQCSGPLYGALRATLPQQQQQGPHSAQQPSCSNVQPAALIIAATSSGQVWLCNPLAALTNMQQAAASIHHAPPLPLLAQQQQQQGQSPHAVKLLLDLQQPVASILPVTLGRIGANALLLVGSLGRLVLLQQRQQTQAQAQGLQQQQQRQQTQQQQPMRQAAPLTASQQLQAPFQVAAAAVVVPCGGSTSSQPAQLQQQGPNNAQQGQNDAQPLLLLLSTSGRLYAASLGAWSAGIQPPTTTTSAAATGGQQAAGASAAAVSMPGLLPLQPVHIPLPAPVSRLWTVPQRQQQSTTSGASNASTTGTHPGVHAFAAGSVTVHTPDSNQLQVHSSVLLQLADSTQLLEISVQDIQATVAAAAAAAAPAGDSASMHPGAAAGAAAGSVSAASEAVAEPVRTARQQLEQLLAALETVAAAKQKLEEAAGQQEAYLQGMQHDMDLLGLLQQQSGTADAQPQLAQQQQSRGLAAVQPGTSAHSRSRLLGSGASRGPALRCRIQLHGLWPFLGSASSADPNSSIHLALSVQLQQAGSSSASTNADSSSSKGFTGQLGPGWQLVVSFAPESADSSSVQTTVDISTDNNSNSTRSSSSSVAGDGSLQASLMLPLPKACAALQQGGWVMVYAVKQPPGALGAPHALCSHAQRQQSHAHVDAIVQQQELPPVVTLLGQQYISVLQLSSMASANPAVQPVVRASGASSLQQVLGSGVANSSSGGASSSGSGGAPPMYSCILRLAASAGGAVRGAPQGRETGTGTVTGPPAAAAAAAQGGVKRPRHDPGAAAAGAAAAAGTGDARQQQQAGGAGSAQAAAHAHVQADSKQDVEAGILALQEWLSTALCLNPGPAVLPPVPPQLPRPQQWNPFGPFAALRMLGVGIGSSVCGMPGLQQQAGQAEQRGPNTATRPDAGAVVKRHGQTVFTLGAGEVGRASWSVSTAQEMPSMQLLDTAAGAVAAGMKRAAASAAVGGASADGTDGGSGGASLAVQLQASRVPILASMHRAVLLDLLQQLEPGSGSSSSGRNDASNTNSGSRSGSAQSWHMVSTVPQLKLAAARLRQLHQHLLKMLDTADQTQDLLQALQHLSPAAVMPGYPSGATDDGSMQAGATAMPGDAEQQVASLRELSAALQGLEQGLYAAYGRFLLAVSDAVQVEVCIN